MKAFEIMNDIIGVDFIEQRGATTVDTLKAGDSQKEVKKIGTCLTATPEVLCAAKEWGADLLITYEDKTGGRQWCCTLSLSRFYAF